MSAPRPLAQHLEPATDEARISRMWRAIRARRRPARPRARWVAVPALAAAMAIAAWLAWPAPGPRPAPAAPVAWSVPERFDAPSARRFALADGSSIALEAGASLATIESGDARFVTLLERGAATFEVRPGGPRRWIVESGLASVEVVGTAFRVERRADAVEVRVTRGVVLVRGERVPDRVARLRAGESIVVASPPPEPAARPSAPTASAEPPPARRPPPPAEDPGALVAQASAAQRAGDPERAAALLRRAMARDDPRAALAAYTLGRIEMDELHRPSRARAALRRALALGLPERMAQQAERRLQQLR